MGNSFDIEKVGYKQKNEKYVNKQIISACIGRIWDRGGGCKFRVEDPCHDLCPPQIAANATCIRWPHRWAGGADEADV